MVKDKNCILLLMKSILKSIKIINKHNGRVNTETMSNEIATKILEDIIENNSILKNFNNEQLIDYYDTNFNMKPTVLHANLYYLKETLENLVERKYLD